MFSVGHSSRLALCPLFFFHELCNNMHAQTTAAPNRTAHRGPTGAEIYAKMGMGEPTNVDELSMEIGQSFAQAQR